MGIEYERALSLEQKDQFLLKCYICKLLLENPCQCGKCRTHFCYKCLKNAMLKQKIQFNDTFSNQNKCPSHLEVLDRNDIKKPSDEVTSRSKTLMITCSKGCGDSYSMFSLRHHERTCNRKTGDIYRATATTFNKSYADLNSVSDMQSMLGYGQNKVKPSGGSQTRVNDSSPSKTSIQQQPTFQKQNTQSQPKAGASFNIGGDAADLDIDLDTNNPIKQRLVMVQKAKAIEMEKERQREVEKNKLANAIKEKLLREKKLLEQQEEEKRKRTEIERMRADQEQQRVREQRDREQQQQRDQERKEKERLEKTQNQQQQEELKRQLEESKKKSQVEELAVKLRSAIEKAKQDQILEKQMKEEQERVHLLEQERQKKLEQDRQEKIEREKQRLLAEEKKRRKEEERQRKLEEERERKLEEEKIRQEELRQKALQEERKRENEWPETPNILIPPKQPSPRPASPIEYRAPVEKKPSPPQNRSPQSPQKKIVRKVSADSQYQPKYNMELIPVELDGLKQQKAKIDAEKLKSEELLFTVQELESLPMYFKYQSKIFPNKEGYKEEDLVDEELHNLTMNERPIVTMVKENQKMKEESLPPYLPPHDEEKYKKLVGNFKKNDDWDERLEKINKRLYKAMIQQKEFLAFQNQEVEGKGNQIWIEKKGDQRERNMKNLMESFYDIEKKLDDITSNQLVLQRNLRNQREEFKGYDPKFNTMDNMRSSKSVRQERFRMNDLDQNSREQTRDSDHFEAANNIFHYVPEVDGGRMKVQRELNNLQDKIRQSKAKLHYDLRKIGPKKNSDVNTYKFQFKNARDTPSPTLPNISGMGPQSRKYTDSFYETTGLSRNYDDVEPEDRVLQDLYSKIQDTEKNVSVIASTLQKMRQSRGQGPNNKLYNDSRGYFGAEPARQSRNRMTPNPTVPRPRPRQHKDQLEHFLDSVLQDDKPRYNDQVFQSIKTLYDTNYRPSYRDGEEDELKSRTTFVDFNPVYD